MTTNADFIDRSTRVFGVAIISVTSVVAIAAVLVLASDIFLILFLGVLFGVFLTRISGILAEHSPMSYGLSLGVVTTLLVLTAIGGFVLFGVQVDKQIDRVRKLTDEGIAQLRDWAQHYPMVKNAVESTPFLREYIDGNGGSSEDPSDSKQDKQESSQSEETEKSALRSTTRKGATAIAGVFKTTFGLVINSLLIFFVGLFIAVEPRNYRDGVVSLFPTDRRKRTREVLDMIGDTLWHWLIGRFATMSITGIGAGILLLVLGVPMAFTLGVVTALFAFIPNIGGIVSLLLASLVAIPEGKLTVLLVVAGFVALQFVESYFITPMIEKKAASLPPALLLAFQAVMGVLFGFWGAAVASPALAAMKVGIEQAYIKDVLECDG